MDQHFGGILNGPTVPYIHKKAPPPLLPLVPAAQYVRMSDEAQNYSIDNQEAAIQEYASRHGFRIVKTYADVGKSGVVAKHRAALRELLKDVLGGNADYRAVLVYDVSRWGRFPNNDEAAHYEFLCHSSGIPLHYCAEPFANDGTASSSLLKALKRSMAAEFSRELGDKVFRGKTRIVQLGFWVGGPPGYGFRRLMVSANGKPKQVMKPGEQKSLTTDRVILIPGPRKELAGIRAIFLMAAEGKGPSAIARELNRKGVTHGGRPWIHQAVRDIVQNPKYMGCNVWNRHSQRLCGPLVPIEPQFWIKKPLAFAPIVDEETFARAQAGLPVPKRWSDDEILKRIRRLLKAKGRLSETLLRKARGMPSTVTLHNHFGTYRQLYEKLGYHIGAEDIHNGAQSERSMNLRQKLVSTIKELFPEHVAVTHLPNRSRSILWIDRSFMVSILLCRTKHKRGKLCWAVDPNPAERGCVTLLCTMNSSHDRVIAYFALPTMDGYKRSFMHDSWFHKAVKLPDLSGFYHAVTKLWAQRSNNARVHRTDFP
jgi:DNA invertase Pin-like site-specific DNA recombinase